MIQQKFEENSNNKNTGPIFFHFLFSSVKTVPRSTAQEQIRIIAQSLQSDADDFLKQHEAGKSTATQQGMVSTCGISQKKGNVSNATTAAVDSSVRKVEPVPDVKSKLREKIERRQSENRDSEYREIWKHTFWKMLF